ncbi:Cna B-type domain-containing protein [Butyrivibrio hungatei]|uniref:LPXTG-motif-containing cell surface protein n=1 Tax=Butyrivibrio hungatei TaxID=185008 RepID=A0A1D9P019_9FIRM|nr:Cna B-type domain-containing protein [Butyrivibrio hungatei]AOZ95821.1 LPXTG-motif-containing cell surface protein [Butyrivibrio hungatei]
MRGNAENRAEKYIKKHENYKKWLAFALCVSILTGTITLYILNKPATAMTEDGAKQVGLVLETADSEFEQGLINEMNNNENNGGDQSGDVQNDDDQDGDDQNDDQVDPSDGDDDQNDDDDNDDANGDDDDAADEATSEDSEEAEEGASDASSSKSSDAADEASTAKSSDKIEDVVITVLYLNAEGEEFEDSKELNIEDSFDLKEEAKEFEGYIFYKGEIDGEEVTKIEKKDGEAKVKSKKTKADEEDDAVASYLYEDEDETVEYSYYEATTVSGDEIEIKKDTDLELYYNEVNTQEEFEYEADGIKVSVKLSNPEVLPAGVELKVAKLDSETEGYNYSAYIDALNKNSDTIAAANGTEEAEVYDKTNVVLFDIGFFFEEKEYQLADGTAEVSITFPEKPISEGLGATEAEEVTVVHLPVSGDVLENVDATSEATDITADDISVEVLSNSKVTLEEEADTISFATDSFSIYGAITKTGEHTWEGSESYSAAEIVGMFGDATYFGVVANDYDGGNCHSEANIAVGTIKNIQQYTIGNSTVVYQHLNSYNVTINKVVQGSPKAGTFNFALFYDVNGTDKVEGSDFTITTGADGEGSYTVDVAQYIKGHASLYVYELDGPNGKPVLNEETCGSYTVTYKGDLIEGDSDIVSYFSDNYIENLNGYMVTGDAGILQKVEGATVYYKTSDSTYVGVQYTNKNSQGYNVKTYDGQFPVSVSDMRSQAETASSRLAYAKDTNNVKVINIIGTTENGYLQTDLTKYYFTGQQDNYAVNKGLYLDKDTLLVINVDLTGAESYTYDKFLLNNEGTGDWHDIANQIVVNFVQKDANGDFVPYTGKINCNIASGLLVAPDAEVSLAGSYAGTIIADSVYKGCEIHKITVRRFLNENAQATVTNTVEGTVANFHLYKYLNNEDPGDLQFSFTVRVMKKDGTLETLTKELTNVGKDISYTFDVYPDYYYTDGKIYLIINENDIKDDQCVEKDTDYIYVRIENLGTEKEDIRYYKAPYDNINVKDRLESNDPRYTNKSIYVTAIAKGDNFRIKTEDGVEPAFYNKGNGYLRIHKMVINDFGSAFVRDGLKENDALLKQVKFRITNKSNGNYIVFQGFVGEAGTEGIATEYPTGKTYKVVYNQSAQWTVVGLPAGTYTVDEVADGFTFEYDESSNTSRPIYDSPYSRVTKYDLTVDAEDPNEKGYGIGGENYRQVYSCDMSNLSDKGPSNVKVGSPDVNNNSHTQTVQVCNYYSNPIGPIQVTKNFAGAEWTEDMQFEFVLEPIGFTIKTSEGEKLSTDNLKQPMPYGSNKVILTGANATKNENGTYSAVAKFDPIPFRFEGTYYYKITETNTRIGGVKYDSTIYYVEMVVEKDYTTFPKSYTSKNMTHPDGEKYPKVADKVYTQDAEDFYYLGATVRYCADPEYKTTLARCKLYLGINPNTNKPETNTYLVQYDEGQSVADVAFNNAKTGYLEISKKWIASDGSDDAKNHTTLNVDIWQRPVGTSDWTLYRSEVLSSTNGWRVEIYDLPIVDANGNKVEYTVKEAEEYLATYTVTYKYSGLSEAVTGNGQSKTKVDGKDVYDTGYVITLGSDGRNFGSVEITNKTVYSNKLPRTGGNGKAPFAAAGIAFMLIAFAGMYISRKRNAAM